MEPYFTGEEREAFHAAFATLEQEGKDAEAVLRQGAACLAAGIV